MKCQKCGTEFEGKVCPQCGADYSVGGKVQTISKNAQISVPLEMDGQGGFDGWLIQMIGWKLLGWLVTICTLGLGYPFAVVWMQKWLCKHTVYQGKRLSFDGNGLQLWGKYIVWWLLSIVTLSIYAWFIPIRMEKWKAKHTHIAGENKELGGSFDGWLLQLLGWKLLGWIVTICTLGICYPFALCWKMEWRAKHSVYDGVRLHFNGNGFQLWEKYIVWWLLSIVTLSIYAWFIPIRIQKWKAKHTILVKNGMNVTIGENGEVVQAKPTVVYEDLTDEQILEKTSADTKPYDMLSAPAKIVYKNWLASFIFWNCFKVVMIAVFIVFGCLFPTIFENLMDSMGATEENLGSAASIFDTIGKVVPIVCFAIAAIILITGIVKIFKKQNIWGWKEEYFRRNSFLKNGISFIVLGIVFIAYNFIMSAAMGSMLSSTSSGDSMDVSSLMSSSVYLYIGIFFAVLGAILIVIGVVLSKGSKMAFFGTENVTKESVPIYTLRHLQQEYNAWLKQKERYKAAKQGSKVAEENVTETESAVETESDLSENNDTNENKDDTTGS